MIANVQVPGSAGPTSAKDPTGKEDAANNFARGHYTIGKEIVDLGSRVCTSSWWLRNCSKVARDQAQKALAFGASMLLSLMSVALVFFNACSEVSDCDNCELCVTNVLIQLAMVLLGPVLIWSYISRDGFAGKNGM